MKAIAIILAAGESLRMGSPKALLAAAPGQTFLARLAQTFTQAGLAPLVVLGSQADRIRAAHPTVASVVNAKWPDGQLSSVRVGLRAALAQGAQRVLVHPIDMPLITAATAEAVLQALHDAPSAIATCSGRAGHPLGLRREAVQTVLEASAATLEGAIAPLVCAHVGLTDPAVLDNLNTPEAYQARFGVPPAEV